MSYYAVACYDLGAAKFYGQDMERNQHPQSFVNHVFDRVSNRYDLMNDVMSMGLHRRWRKHILNYLPAQKAMIMDLACGTGDVTMMLARAGYPVIACDINALMLREGIKKTTEQGCVRDITWVQCSAERLPFADNSLGGCTIAFGMRNVENRCTALKEILRVLQPGGHFVCLEFSQMPNPNLAKLYHMYSKFYVPLMGSLLANNREAYQYLIESISHFPTAEDFANTIREIGFIDVGFQRLQWGVVALHHGIKG